MIRRIDLSIPSGLVSEMLDHIQREIPNEACGLIAGLDTHAIKIFPVSNKLSCPYRFRMDEQEQIDAILSAESMGLDILCIYHSHPNGLDKPSQTDIDESNYPEWFYLIWYESKNQWRFKGYQIIQQRTKAIDIKIT